MSARPCKIALNLCPEADSPITNISAEAPDPLLFFGTAWPAYDPYQPPPIFAPPGSGSTIDCQQVQTIAAGNQALANLLAEALGINCPNNGTQYGNDEQTATATCGNGSTATYTVPANTLTFNTDNPQEGAAWLAYANAWAAAYAFEQVSSMLDCGSAVDLPPPPGPVPPTGGGPSADPIWLCLGQELNPPLSFSVGSHGVDYTLSISGSLPPNLQFVQTGSHSCRIFGTVTAPGVYPFTIEGVAVGSPLRTVRVPEIIYVFGIVNSPELGSVGVCDDFSLQLSAAGGTEPYSFSAGVNFPDWLTISPGGLLSGRPQSVDADKDYEFAVVVTDANDGQCDKLFRVSVAPCPTMAITPPALPNGVVGQVYSQVMTVVGGGSPPFTWSAVLSAMPPGLGMTVNGFVNGIPTLAGDYTFGVTATDFCGCSVSAIVTMSVGTVGNAAQTATCPTNGAITNTVPQNTYINRGAYAGYSQQQLNDIASAAAINGLNGLGCSNCNFTLDVVAGATQLAHTTCLVQLHVSGPNLGGNTINCTPPTTNLHDALDLLTAFNTHGVYQWAFFGHAFPPFDFSTSYP